MNEWVIYQTFKIHDGPNHEKNLINFIFCLRDTGIWTVQLIKTYYANRGNK
jgi:hypothetical protein